MSPEAQRIAIAEACGWKIERDVFARLVSPDGKRGHSCGTHLSTRQVWQGNFHPHPEKPLLVPDYLNDLNAMHEAEKILIGDYSHGLNGRDASSRFSDELISVTTCDGFYHVHATAAQRAEAFLRTKGLLK